MVSSGSNPGLEPALLPPHRATWSPRPHTQSLWPGEREDVANSYSAILSEPNARSLAKPAVPRRLVEGAFPYVPSQLWEPAKTTSQPPRGSPELPGWYTAVPPHLPPLCWGAQSGLKCRTEQRGAVWIWKSISSSRKDGGRRQKPGGNCLTRDVNRVSDSRALRDHLLNYRL